MSLHRYIPGQFRSEKQPEISRLDTLQQPECQGFLLYSYFRTLRGRPSMLDDRGADRHHGVSAKGNFAIPPLLPYLCGVTGNGGVLGCEAIPTNR
jgi:hypothetical protein